MGVEYQHFAIPRDNTFRPTADQLAGLIKRLEEEQWICSPANPSFPQMNFYGFDYYAQAESSGFLSRSAAGFLPGMFPVAIDWLSELMHNDVMLIWPVCDYGAVAEHLKYPVTPETALEDEPYFDLKIHISNDYVYRVSEVIEPFKSTMCECGAELQYWPDLELKGESIFYSSRIKVQCDQCHKTSDPSRWTAQCINGWTGAKSQVKGGATARFAVSIDCGKCLPPTETGNVTLNSRLKALLEEQMQTAFYEIGDIY